MTESNRITCSIVDTGTEQFCTVFVPGHDPLPAGSDHPNFSKIVDLATSALKGEAVDAETLIGLFDVENTVKVAFERLTDRVTVEDGIVKLDGDAVSGALQAQILDFVEKGEDFGPLVRFYEKLLTNPLGNVQEGIYTWITSNRENGGGFTITPDGDLIGYKSVKEATPQWREGSEPVYVPSRTSDQDDRVNDQIVPRGKYIEQRPGDVVEMPRSKVLNAPSVACADGLHIGTFSYAEGFYGDTVMLVKFSPRDVVSLPASNSTWKLRVNRYTVVGPVEEALDVPLLITEDVEDEADEAAAEAGVNPDLILA